MSPASAGPLEVERYIGACLISSHSRNKNPTPNNNNALYPGYMSYRPRRCNGWAGGMPLISFANPQRRNNNKQEQVVDTRCSSPRVNIGDDGQLSRLAVHTQGLPLILSGRQGNRRTKTPRNGPVQPRVDSPKKLVDCKDSTTDSLSVASDESSSSINSETSLPRIIKPRKRRKKDRKPHPVRAQEEPCTGSSNIVTLKPYIPYCFERYARERVHPPRNNTVRSSASPDSITDKKSSVDETPQLHHRFEDVAEDADTSSEPSLCQCRYCDPAGQIWDVDRHCYSPFLTSPPFRQLYHSLSDPTGDVSFKRQLHLSDALRSQCLISSFALDVEDIKEKVPNRTQCLEISTKIVTSPNGHRDLEIRLFSSLIDDDRPKKESPTDKSETSSKLCADKNECERNLIPEE